MIDSPVNPKAPSSSPSSFPASPPASFLSSPSSPAPGSLPAFAANAPERAPLWGERLVSHSAFLLLCRLAAGGSLLLAASQKIQSPKAFALSIEAFGMVPAALIVPLAFFLIWQELMAGACLVAGIWTRGAALISAGLLMVFLGALGWAVIRGMSISCGCFGSLGGGDAVGWSSVARNALLSALALWTSCKGGGAWAIEQLWARRKA